MKRNFTAITFAVLVSCLSFAFCAEEKPQKIFFDNALREYSKGNFEKAITNLKIAKVSDPDNEAVKSFLVKILVETSQKSQENKNYIEALRYAEDALSYDRTSKAAMLQKEEISKLLSQAQQPDAPKPAAVVSKIETPAAKSADNSGPYKIIAVASSLLFAGTLLFAFSLRKKYSSAEQNIENLSKELKLISDDRNLLLTKLVQTKDQSTREKISLMAINLYEFNPSEALNFLSNMAKSPNPAIRANVVYSLATIANSETLDILFTLYTDTDPKVKGEVLRSIKEIDEKIDKNELQLDTVLQHKIKYMLANEKTKKEWIF